MTEDPDDLSDSLPARPRSKIPGLARILFMFLAAGISVIALVRFVDGSETGHPGIRGLKASLQRDALAAISPGEAAERVTALVDASIRAKRNPANILASIFPSPPESIAMLARDRDVDDFEESSESGGQAGNHYSDVVDLVPVMRPLRDSYVAIFIAAHERLVEKGRAAPATARVHSIAAEGEATPPRERDMDVSHTFALDIFFSNVDEMPLTGKERGPIILSASGGIVIATASDWSGGPGIETYRKGGISPNAGNGAIIFDPASRRFFCYFHLYNVVVKPGMTISAGDTIGSGGDTGSNARKPGHGQHLHLEIFDTRTEKFLRNTEIKALVF